MIACVNGVLIVVKPNLVFLRRQTGAGGQMQRLGMDVPDVILGLAGGGILRLCRSGKLSLFILDLFKYYQIRLGEIVFIFFLKS